MIVDTLEQIQSEMNKLESNLQQLIIEIEQKDIREAKDKEKAVVRAAEVKKMMAQITFKVLDF